MLKKLNYDLNLFFIVKIDILTKLRLKLFIIVLSWKRKREKYNVQCKFKHCILNIFIKHYENM